MMISFKSFILQEGVLDRDVTDLSRVIISNIKKREQSILSLNPGANYQFTFSKNPPQSSRAMERLTKAYGIYVGNWGELEIPEDLKQKYPSLLINVSVGEPRHNGFFDRTNGVLSAEIGIPLNGERLDYHAALPMIKAVLRHELEHSQQSDQAPFTRDMNFSGWPATDSKVSGGDFGDVDSMHRYLGHPSEVEAWVSGMYKYAKTAKVPFSQAVDSQLNRIFGTMVKSGADAQSAKAMLSSVKSQWLAYQRHRFPTAVV